MFWDNFVFLCNQKGVAPNVAAAAVGVKSSGTVTGWKNGATPRQGVLRKLADYFGVSVDVLSNTPTTLLSAAREAVANQQFAELPIEKREAMLAGAKEKAAIDVVDDDLQEYLDELRSRPEKRLLFSVTKHATKSQIEAIVKMIEEMQGAGDGQ